MFRLLACVLVALVAAAPAARADPDVRVALPRIEGDGIVVDFQVDGLLDAAAREALESGLPARVRFQVELWRQRSRLWDTEVGSIGFGYRILFDVLEEEYQIYDERGRFVAGVGEPEEIEDLVGQEVGLRVASTEDLTSQVRYYVLVEVQLSPLSVEEVRDLQEWVRGNLRGGKGRLGGLSEQILGIFRNKMGLGERRALARCPAFRPGELERTP